MWSWLSSIGPVFRNRSNLNRNRLDRFSATGPISIEIRLDRLQKTGPVANAERPGHDSIRCPVAWQPVAGPGRLVEPAGRGELWISCLIISFLQMRPFV